MKHGLTQQDVDRVVEQGLGGESGRCKASPFGEGAFSSTFLVKTPEGERVLRIAPPDSLRLLFYERRMMRQEPALHRLIGKRIHTPIATIVAHDFSRRIIDRDWLAMERLPGEPLIRTAQKLWPAQLDAVLESLGRHVRRLHSIKAKRYGYLGRHRPMEPQSSWPDAFALMFEKLVADVVDTQIVPVADGRFAVDLLRRKLDAFPRDPGACLCHMDLWSANLLVDGNATLTGILDFDRACWGHIENEFAVTEYCGLAKPAFWRGYGWRPFQDEAWAVRRFFYLIYEHAKYVVIHASERHGDPASAARYAGECWTALRNFNRTGKPAF